MDNTIQLYSDREKKNKVYPITSPDRVIDENGVNIKDKIEEINSSLDNIALQLVLNPSQQTDYSFMFKNKSYNTKKMEW